MDIVRLHEQAMDETARLVGGVRADQMGFPTPCSDWDVRALIAHLVGGNVRYAGVAEGTPVRRGPEGTPTGRGAVADDLLGDDPESAYRRSAEVAEQAWRDPALLDRQFELPFGTLPGRAALGMHLVETVTHAWDLAKATGQQPSFDPQVVQTASQFARSSMPDQRPPGYPFDAPASVADDATELDHLAAFLGRKL